MTTKMLCAALLAATTLVPGSLLAADADAKAGADQTTTGKGDTDKSSSSKAATDKSASGKATTDKASSSKATTDTPASGKATTDTPASGKAATGKSSEGKSGSAKASGEKAAAGKDDASKTGKPTAAAKADAAKTDDAKPGPDQGAGGKAAAAAAVGAVAGAAGVASIAAAAGAGSPVDYTKMSPAELTEYLIFDAKGFKLDQPTQEGKTGRERMTQDELQKVCSALKGNPVDAATAKQVQVLAAASRVYPEGGITLGDWKKGEALAKEGAGFRLGPKADDNQKMGGNCYACHQMDLKVSAHGTIGPALTGFGKNRGNTPETQKYVYEVIYNAHAYFPCTNMPRFGANGFLNQEQIADLMAYLLNPESPVNH